jgi:hypothetical protein
MFLSGAGIDEPFAFNDGVCCYPFVGHPNSKCTEENGAHEQKNGAHHEHIESQGKVHVRASLAQNTQA